MRTNIDIDDDLMRQALETSGATTKKDAVRLGLEALVRLSQQRQIRSLRGQLSWEGDLDDARTDDSPANSDSLAGSP